MSEPKKVRRWYYECDSGYGGEIEHPEGHLVFYVDYEILETENARLKAEVERLTKAVMHSPAAQLKLKELEGKTTFDEINPKGGQP